MISPKNPGANVAHAIEMVVIHRYILPNKVFSICSTGLLVGIIAVNTPAIILEIATIVNMIFSLVAGKLLKFNLEDIILASNANIGGPTTAAAMAVSKGWTKLVGPIVLVGTLGYVLGTYFGLIVGSILGL